VTGPEPTPNTADLCDAHPDAVRVLSGGLHDYGARPAFHGEVTTLRSIDDWRPVYAVLQEEGRGRVLVVDGGGSREHAILGERLLGTAERQGWAGVVIWGSVRDTAQTRRIAAGLRALATCPMRGELGGVPERDVALLLGGVRVGPGDHLYADADGVIVSDRAIVA